MDERSLDAMVEDLETRAAIAFDLETIGLDEQHPRAKIMCVSLSGEKGKGYVVPFHHPESSLNPKAVRDALDYLFGLPKHWVAHNGKFDVKWLKQFGFTPPILDRDTIIMAHLLDENQPKNVESVAARYLGVSGWKHLMNDDFKAVQKALEKGTSIPYPPLDVLAKYAAIDADIELQLAYQLWHRMDVEQKRLHDLLIRVSHTLQSVEQRGVYIDLADLDAAQKASEEAMAEAERRFENVTGYTGVNLNSPKQLVEVLFNGLNLPVVSFTAASAPSTSEHALKVLLKHTKKERPTMTGAVQAVLDYRLHSKRVGSYYRPWRVLLNGESRLRSSYNITGTVTGRLSCTNVIKQGMSLHQVPRASNVRSVVSAPAGRRLVVADFSQIELRVAAVLAEEPRMMQAYKKKEDIHRLTAATVLNKKLKDVTDDDRTKAKAVNFGFLYGMGAPHFVDYAFDNYGVEFSLGEAELVREAFFTLYTGLRPWHKAQEAFVRKHGYVRSPIGRVRHLPDVHSPEKGVQYEAVRQAINSPVQSLASDFTLIAMARAHEVFIDSNAPAQVVGQVHDSILVEADEHYAPVAADTLQAVMQGDTPEIVKQEFGYRFPLPLVADVEICKKWGQPEEKTA